MELFRQLRLMLWKNALLKKRSPSSTVFEIFFIFVAFIALIIFRALISTTDVPQATYERNRLSVLNNSTMTMLYDATCTMNQSHIGIVYYRNEDEAAARRLADHIKKRIISVANATFPLGPPTLGVLCKISGNPTPLLDYVNSSLIRIFAGENAVPDYVALDDYGTTANPFLWLAVVVKTTQPKWEYVLHANRSTGIRTFGSDNLALGHRFDRWKSYTAITPMQLFTDQFILGERTGNTNFPEDVTFVPFPTAEYTADNFATFVSSVYALLIVLFFMYPFSRLIRNIVQEKEDRIKEGLGIMGLYSSVFWISWAITYFFIFLIGLVIGLVITKNFVFKYSDGFLIFLLFLLFAVSIVGIGSLSATFFSRAKTSGTFGALIILFLFFPYFLVSDETATNASKNAASLCAPVAFALASTNMLEYESASQGIQFDNMYETRKNYRFADALLMLFIDSLIYFFFAWYLDHVLPKEFGVSQHPLFLFHKSYWFPKHLDEKDPTHPLVQADDVKEYAMSPIDALPEVEPVSDELKALSRVQIKRLRKTFTNDGVLNVAVNSLDLEMYQGEIFVLLGHNGAGKTTTINMLTGMLPVTNGDATVYGQSVVKDMDTIRRFLGLCPQHDILFPTLTVAEHLDMYAQLKRVPKDKIPALIKEAIADVQLEAHTNDAARTLSGGEKRRLSLAISFIGDPKIVFLDEPTSGVDTYSRRAIWDMLLKKRKDRVIILTTHFMDEADQLGDRVAILHHGKLRCCGTSLFLKRKFGVGYTIALTKKEQGHDEEIGKLIKSHVDSAQRVSNAAGEIVFRLPMSGSGKFSMLLKDLDTQKESLGLQNYGLSVTTLEEVFLKIASDSGPDVDVKEEDKIKPKQDISDFQADPSQKSHWRHFVALMKKRFYIAKRDRRAFYCQFVIPLAILIIGLQVVQVPTNFTFPVVDFDVGSYNKPLYVPVHNATSPPGLAYDLISQNILPSEATVERDYNGTDLRNFAWSLLGRRTQYQQSRYGAFMMVEPNKYYTFVNDSAVSGIPAFMNLANSAALRGLSNDSSASIQAGFQYFPLTKLEKEGVRALNGVFASIMVAMAFSFIPASVAVFIVKEKESKAKHLQFISGVNIYVYWIQSFIWDYLLFLLPMLLACAVIALNDISALVGENFGALVLSFFMYGLSVIPFTYLLSFLFEQHSTAQNVMIMLYLLTGVLLVILNFILYIIPDTREANDKYIRHIFRLFPNYCVADTVFFLSLRDIMRKDKWDMTISGHNLIFMAWESVVYFALVLVIEKIQSKPDILTKFKADPVVEDAKSVDDEDVLAERERLQRGGNDKDIISIQGLRKTYHPNRVSVKDLWYSIPAGQCFGFLGVNGAGKTTTMKMITGDVVPTRGTARINGFDIVTQAEDVHLRMGYCPQFDALHELLSAKEHLQFYGKIRGIPDAKIDEMVSYLIDRLTLTEYANRPAGTYSGGNKRKLSVAIALIGNPPAVLLDEPSTGMDPVSRRFMWNFISETMGKRAVILTTHSMEECEALCQRIAILSHGELKCIGTAQHLKSRFGNTLQVDLSTSDKPVDMAIAFIREAFRGAELVEQYGSRVKFRVPKSDDISLSSMFDLIEQNRARCFISDYSIGQTTLEQIFNNFASAAKKNEVDDRSNKPPPVEEDDFCSPACILCHCFGPCGCC